MAYILTHEELTSELTGEPISYESFLKSKEADKKVREQTEAFAKALKGIGVSAYSKTSSDITAIGLVSGRMLDLKNYRKIMFLPSIAKRERSKHLNALEKFMNDNIKLNNGNNYLRFGVVTAGKPLVPGTYDDDGNNTLKKAIQVFTQNISRASFDVKKLYGVNILYRGVEFTLKDRDGSGVPTLHLHANIVYILDKVLPDKEWKEFLEYFGKRTGGNHWKDCGIIKNIKEVVKYVIKPDDIMSVLKDSKPVTPVVSKHTKMLLCNTSDIILDWLYHGLFRAHLSTPMRAFKDYVAALEVAGLKVVHGGKRGLIEVRKAQRLGSHDVEENNRKKEEFGASTSPCRNHILGTTLPTAVFMPWKEPLLLVQNMDRNGLNWDELQVEIAGFRHDALQDWHRNGGPDVNTALKIADAIIDGAAHNVVPLTPKKPVEESEPFIVHTPTVVIQNSEDSNKPESEEGLIRLNKYKMTLTESKTGLKIEIPQVKKRRTA